MTTNSKPNLCSPLLFKNNSRLEQECDALKQKLDAEYKAMPVGKKLNINHGNENNYYLPLPSKLFEFLGFKSGIVNYISKLEAMGAETLNISRSSQYDLQNKGVGVRTHKKLIYWMLNNFGSLMHLAVEGKDARLDLSYQLNSNAFSWLTMLKTMEVLGSGDDNLIKPEYTYLLKFINLRCDKQIYFQQHVKNEKVGGIGLNNTGASWKQYANPFLHENTVLPLALLDNLDPLMEDASYANRLNPLDKRSLLKNCLRLKFDFLLSAIAHYEVGYAIRFCPDNKNIASKYGLVGKAISKYSNSEEDRTCFDYSLEVLKDRLSDHIPDMSWRKLATYIEINESGEKAELLTDKKYNRLKDWRKGKNLPANELLKQFSTNILNNDSDDTLFICCRIAIGIDKMMANLEDELVRELGSVYEVKLMWKKILSHYKNDYYLHYLNLYTGKK